MHASLTEWWNGISLRTRITGVTVLIMTIGLAVSGFGTMTLLRDALLQDVDKQISTALKHVDPASLKIDSPTEYVAAEFDANGRMVSENPTWHEKRPSVHGLTLERVEQLKQKPFTVRERDGTAAFRIAVAPKGAGSVALGLPLAATNNVIARLFTLFLLLGLVVGAPGAVPPRLLVGSALGPLRQVDGTAAAIADGAF